MIRKTLRESDIKAFRELLRASQNVVLTCHVRPDGDAIGSTLGLGYLLKAMGKNPVVVTPDHAPRSLQFITQGSGIVSYTQYKAYTEKVIADADLIICCDFNAPSRQDALAHVVQASRAKKVLIDHHQEPEHFAEIEFSYPEMSSTCELAFRIIAALRLYDLMPKASAQALLTGMITDTRNFTVNCSSPDIYEIMAKLMEKGADKQQIVREALQLRSLDSLRLQAFAINERMEVFERHGAAVITLSAEDLKRYHYEKGDSEGLVNMPLDVRGIVYSVFLREDPDCIKVSARSVENFPVSEICKHLYGGGGHLMAAGGEYHGSLEDCRKLLIDAMPEYDRYLPERFMNKMK